jgi:hypothetical protein
MESVKLLLAKGCNPNVLNHDLDLPLDVIIKDISPFDSALHASIRSLLIIADPSRRTMVQDSQKHALHT